jgi:hypothetical protein
MVGKTPHTIDRGAAAGATLVGLLALGLMIGGCARPRKTAPSIDPATLDDMAFQGYLADVPVVTADEACRAMLILADGEDKTKSWDQRRAELLRRGLIRSAWGLRPGDVVSRGTVAYMICEICRIRGGVNRLLLGSWGPGDRRYAHRELVHVGLMSAGTEWQHMTGGQMVALLGKADELMEKKGLYESESLELEAQPALDRGP